MLAGVVLALLLAVRLLAPAGFMPSFEHGSVTIVACPDLDPPQVRAPMAGHHHHGPKKLHQTCSYAAGGTFATAIGFGLITAVVLIGAALLLGRPFQFSGRHRSHDWPPLRGPPVPA